jgi:competence protein ComEC
MKKIFQYIPLHLSVFLTIGVLIGYYYFIPINLLIIFSVASITLLIAVLWLNKKRSTLSFTLQTLSYFTVLVIGITSIRFYDSSQIKTHYSHYVSNGNKLLIQIDKKLKPTVYQDKYYAQILQINAHSCSGKIVLNTNKNSTINTLQIGKVYQVKTDLYEINKPLNPYTFNYNKYLNNQGVQHQIAINYNDLIEVDIEKNSLKIYATIWRDKIQSSLKKYPFKKNEMAIINAIILGQRQSISKDLLDNYAGAGAIHILAVSGLHVGILFLLLSFILKPIERIPHGNHLKTVLIILILWGFTLLTGLSASVIRAVTMFTFIAIGLAIKNERSAVLHALITSYFILVLIHPLFIFDVGFQMSYTAVLGIVLLQPKIEKTLPKTQLYFLRKTWQLLSVSIAATIGTLPISLYYFHQFPSLFFVSNIVIIPFIGVIMSLGLVVALLALVNILPVFLVKLYGGILQLMNGFIEWIASQEQFLFKDISFSIYVLIASYFLIGMGYLWWREKKTSNLLVFSLSILLLQSIFIFEKYKTESTSESIVFHKSKESFIGIKEGNRLQLLYSSDTLDTSKIKFVKNYQIGSKITSLKLKNKIPSLIICQDKKILVVDSFGVYKDISINPDIVLLRQSPKINLDRLLKEYKPKILIADGSNYKNYVNHWRETCLKDNVNFHYTGLDGAYVLK